MTDYNFKVEYLEGGQRKKYGDSFYSYKVTSNRPEHEVRNFCMNVLKKSYEPEDMHDPFVGRLLEFKKITDNNGGEETYSYKLKTEYTG